MSSTCTHLLFPSTFARLRKNRRLLQKSTADKLGVDPTVLCAIEKGTRAPLDDKQIAKAVEVLKLADEDASQLRWAAHHDRLIGHLEQRGATEAEVVFISTGLHALRHLQPQQIVGLTGTLEQIGKSARMVASLARSNPTMEVVMT